MKEKYFKHLVDHIGVLILNNIDRLFNNIDTLIQII